MNRRKFFALISCFAGLPFLSRKASSSVAVAGNVTIDADKLALPELDPLTPGARVIVEHFRGDLGWKEALAGSTRIPSFKSWPTFNWPK